MEIPKIGISIMTTSVDLQHISDHLDITLIYLDLYVFAADPTLWDKHGKFQSVDHSVLVAVGIIISSTEIRRY